MQIVKKSLSIILRISISVFLLIFLFKQVDIKSLWVILKNADKGLLFLAFLIFFSNYILPLLRWEMLLKAAKIHLSLKRIIISFAAGVLSNLFLPSTIGGDLVRSVDLAVHTKRPREVVATVLLDRLSGFVGLVTVALLALLFGRELVRDKSVLISIGIITVILIIALLVLFNQFLYSKVNKLLYSRRGANGRALSNFEKLREALKNLHQELNIFKHRKKLIINNLILSVLIQAVSPIAFYIIAKSIGIKLKIIYFFIFLPIIGAITLLPISIGGLGLRDATTIFFFAKVGVHKDLAFALSLLSFLFILIYAGIAGTIYVLTIHHRRI